MWQQNYFCAASFLFRFTHNREQTAARGRRTKPPAAYIEKVSAFKRCAGACSVLFKSQRTDFTAAAAVCVVMWQKEAQRVFQKFPTFAARFWHKSQQHVKTCLGTSDIMNFSFRFDIFGLNISKHFESMFLMFWTNPYIHNTKIHFLLRTAVMKSIK